MKKVICNEGCKQEFLLLEFGVVVVRDDIERVGFQCPYCKKEYTTSYTNDHIKKLQEEQRVLLGKSDPRKLTALQLKGIQSKINNKKKQIKTAMDKLRKEIEAG